MKIIYTGFFISKEEASRLREMTSLEKATKDLHVTCKFSPSEGEIKEEHFGKNVVLKAVGYGNDGKNEGLKVEILAGSPELRKMFWDIKVPHITLATEGEGKPVDTAKLSFEPLDEPFYIKAFYGAFCDGGEIIGR